MTLASLCSCSNQFESNLVANSEDTFSRDEAHIMYSYIHVQRIVFGVKVNIAAILNTTVAALKIVGENCAGREHSTFVIVGRAKIPIVVAVMDIATPE